MENILIKVDGMTCGGCTSGLEKALGATVGVTKVVASLEDKSVSIDFDPAMTRQAALEQAIDDAGFDVVK